MSEESERFRIRAKECRELADKARDPVARRTLVEIADDLEVEADMIEAEER